MRTLEDRGLVDRARIAGPGALDSQRAFFALFPSLTERDYLLTVFRELTHLPAAEDLFNPRHNPLWLLGPSAEAAQQLLQLFRTPSAEEPMHRFGGTDTRFLGDLYQDLSEDVRKRYALLQTPAFVERFILDRTLEPAIERFGLEDTSLIDPTCGSGHFLLGAFARLFDKRLQTEPGLSKSQAAEKALSAIAGSDINPYAVAIARFRLTLAFLEKTGQKRLRGAPKLPLNVVVADSLLYNPHQSQQEFGYLATTTATDWQGAELSLEDEPAARRVLHRQYTAVVGNPPYITVKDAVLRERYRKAYPRCASGKYAVSAPFTERFFQLAKNRGFVGMITANSFMKREFGKKLIEEYLKTVNLETVINTSGAFIPGHGTPTVLLFGTTEPPREDEVLTVLASRGEPSTPEDPEKGLVWSSIAEHWADVGFENEYISVTRTPRANLAKHPWSLGGGGATELKELLEERAEKRLGEVADSIGIASVTGEDDVYLLPPDAAKRLGVGRTIPLVTGEYVRDWSLAAAGEVVFPYTETLEVKDLRSAEAELRYLWPFRAVLSKRRRFGTPMLERGLTWYELQELYVSKLRTPLSITFAFVATHNHFVLDKGGKVFNRTAPIIKLPESATEDDHYALLAYLNSSTACFWMKQVMQSKHSAEHKTHPEPERNRYEHAGTALEDLPIPNTMFEEKGLILAARRLSEIAAQRSSLLGDAMTAHLVDGDIEERLLGNWRQFDELREQMVAWQEEVDWRVYEMFGLTPMRKHSSVEPLSCPRGDRPCERINPRKSFVRAMDHLVPLEKAEVAPVNVLSRTLEDTWQVRVRAIRSSNDLQLLETPLFKRQWRDTDENCDEFRFREDFDRERVERWVLSQIELGAVAHAQVWSLRDLSSELAGDAFGHTLEWLKAKRSVSALVAESAIPFLGAYRHTESGLEKHALWQLTWDLQRREDAGEKVGDIPVPPKYDNKDYLRPEFWSLRGKLDVPKERFISYPGCESDEDKEPVYGWAGWNHLQRAQALVALYQQRKSEGWTADRLTPMLAGMLELLPWLKQWHAEPDPELDGARPSDQFEALLVAECAHHGLTQDKLRAWRPATRKTKKAKAKASPDEETEPS